MENHKKVAENVRAELGRKGSKMIDVANALEISTEALRQKRNGSAPFTIDEVGIIAEYLDIPLATLYSGVDNSPVESAT